MYNLIFGIMFFLAPVILSATEKSQNVQPVLASTSVEKSMLSVSIDNDLFFPTQTDRDYTAGFAITYQGSQLNKVTKTLTSSLNSIDEALINIDNKQTNVFEIGSFGFTPEDIDSDQLDKSDRPYASIIYVSSSQIYLDGRRGNAWTSALTVGLLGIDLFKGSQHAIHKVLNGDDAKGWDRQISEGGELTARYQLAYHDYISKPLSEAQLKVSYFGSVGYLTETGVALSFRDGLISSPDYRFNPSVTSYGEHANAVDAGAGGRESYFWGGAGLKLRAYNAFLEGQFRDSTHTFNKTSLKPVIGEIWLGYTLSLFKGSKFSYIVRAQSSELKHGTGDRNLIWGGFVFTKTLI